MNGKNIKKSLNAKLKDWTSHIEDKTVQKIILENALITGGAIVSLLTGDEVHDYDVYFRDRKSLLAVAEYYVNQWNRSGHDRSVQLISNEETGQVKCFISSAGVVEEPNEPEVSDSNEEFIPENEAANPDTKKYRPVFMTSNAITLSNKIQIVTRFYGEAEEIHKNYDFVHCTCAWSAWDNNLILPVRALECIINKELYYIGSKYPLCSIIRTRKYIKRGYTINAGQYLKMCLQLNDLNLHDIETLKDQLVGVDSTYFEIAIAKIEAKKSEDPSFVFDNSYVFEVINRIF